MSTEQPVAKPRRLEAKPFLLADKIFFGLANAAAYSAIVIILLVLVFLLGRAWPAFAEQGVLAFVTGSGWDNSTDPILMRIGPMLYGTLLIAALAVAYAVPLAISIAYFIEFLAPKSLSKIATLLIDLLAAIPSVVVGLWGLMVFSPVAAGWAEMLNSGLGWIPIFAHEEGNYLNSPFIAALVLGTMIVPIIASVTREIFSQMDHEVIKASLALGGNAESTFRKVILPTSASGIVGGVLLGLGRAMGETVAIYFVLNLVFDRFNWAQILEPEGGNVASLILSKFGEANAQEVEGLMAAGVVLFVVTLIVNALASFIVAKAQPWRKAQ
jgi:phosphate transport system permease protein